MNKKGLKLSLIFGLVFLLAAYYVSGVSTLTVHFPHADSYFNNASMNNTIYADTEGNIVINASVNLDLADANITNVTYWYRALGTTAWSFIGSNDTFNLTEYAGNYTYIILWNISNVTGTDGTYQMNVTANNGTTVDDPQQTEIASSIFNIIVDRTNPTTEMDTLDPITKRSKATFYYGDIVSIKCTRSDATSGFNDTNISVIVPQSTDVSAVTEDRSVGTGSTEFTYKYTNTKRLGTYVIKCDTVDRAGNVNHTANKTIEIVTKPPRGGTRPKGFVNPIGKKIVSGSINLGRVTEEGTSIQMRMNAIAKVDIKGETYSFQVKKLSEEEVTLELGTSEITIKKGESAEVDVDKDGTNDIEVTFHKQFKSGSKATADVTFKEITTPVTEKEGAEGAKEDVTKKADKLKPSSIGSLIVTIIVIIAIIIIGYVLIKGKKK